MGHHGRIMRRRRPVPFLPLVLLLFAATVLGACTSGADDEATSSAADAVASLTLTGDIGLVHHTDDGRIVMDLRTGPGPTTTPRPDDAGAGDPTRPADLATSWARTENELGAPDAVVAIRGSEVSFALEDVALEAHQEGSVRVSGEPVGEPPPATFEDWSLSLVPEDEGEVAMAATGDAGGPVLELDDDEVMAALRAAPPTPSIRAVDLVGEPDPPSRFAAAVEVDFTSDGRYEVDVNTPGVGDPRSLATLVEVSAGSARLVDPDANGLVRLVDQRSDGQGVRVRVGAGPFDVGSVTRVSVQVRRVEAEGAERPWQRELGCAPPAGDVTWRPPGTDAVRVAPCPDPYGWVVSTPVVPSLRPDPASVAASAGFDQPASLATHLERLVTVVGAGAESTSPRRIRIGVQGVVDVVRDAPTVPAVTVPIVLIDTDRGDLDPEAAAAAIQAWVDRSGVEVDRLRFDVMLSTSDPVATLLVVNGVELGWG